MGTPLGPKIAQAENKHYQEVQGGVPKVEEKNGLTVVTHSYEGGEGMVVRSHKTLEDYGTVVLSTSEGPRVFQTGMLRRFHGNPCENESLRAGGPGYDRKG